jgi:hypothetical protein
MKFDTALVRSLALIESTVSIILVMVLALLLVVVLIWGLPQAAFMDLYAI